jgi:3-deoxy-D-manno-octulosonic-acid transferase
MYFIYTLSLMLGLLLASPYYLCRFGRYFPTLRDRLGFTNLPQLKGSIWVHAVSLGEFKAVELLLERLRRQFPDKPLVVSTTTPAGQKVAAERRDIVDHILFFPFDLPWCVRRIVDRINPEMVIVAETEIWPNFLRACRERNVRVAMINGRISDKSFERYKLVRRWLQRVLQDYAIIGMQSETDRKRIEALGADPKRVTVFGNLKYDVVQLSRPLDVTLASFLSKWKQIWIAASTMPGEEEFVLDAFRTVRSEHSELKLVVAPRHPNRFDAVETIIRNRGFSCVRRSRLDSEPDILLLDTIGELPSVFERATVVFMGGSLVPTGGHNVLEPARHRNPVVFGPHMENFRDIARLFLDANAAIQIQNSNELAPVISKLLSNPAAASELGKNAFAVLQQNTGATERVMQVLKPVEACR